MTDPSATDLGPSTPPSTSDLRPSNSPIQAGPGNDTADTATPAGSSLPASRPAPGGESPRAARSAHATGPRHPVDASLAARITAHAAALARARAALERDVVEAAGAGASVRAIAPLAGVSHGTVASIVARHRAARQDGGS